MCAEDLRVARSCRNAVNQAGNGSALCVLVCGRPGECVLVRGPARAGGGAGPGRSDTSPRYRQKMDKGNLIHQKRVEPLCIGDFPDTECQGVVTVTK